MHDQPVLPADFFCPYCRHELCKHGSWCSETRCSCRMTFDKLKWQAGSWARKENRRRKKLAKKQGKVVLRSLDKVMEKHSE